MIKPFIGVFPITQIFGVNKQNYIQFGLQGHNGLDYGCPMSTEIIATHSGIVKECGNDPKGYGLYIKIENDLEGSIYAHLANQFITVGQRIRQGDHIGNSNNTGNSTGPHLHFGYYRIPRDKTNGYSGYIDPTPYFGPPEIVLTNPPLLDNTDNMTEDEKIALQILHQDVESIKNPDSTPRFGNLESAARSLPDLVRDNQSLEDQIELLQTALNASNSNDNTQPLPTQPSDLFASIKALVDKILSWFK